MRLIKISFLSSLLMLFILSSCSIQKRHYSSGYNIDWIGKGKKPVINNTYSTKVSDEKKDLNYDDKSNPLLKGTDVQDPILIASSNKEIDANILKAVNFKGRVVNASSQKPNNFHFEKSKAKKDETKPESGAKKGKSQLVALLLCIFVGILGIHRFYLGHIGIGIIQILTLGGCGIWALIDLIMIITGDLKPKDGSDYEKKL